MADEDRFESVDEMTKSHQYAEGASVKEDLHVKINQFHDYPFFTRQKALFKQYLTPKIVLVFWLWFGVQVVVAPLLGISIGSEQWLNLFMLSEDNFLSVALFTNIIGHGSLFHIAINSFVFLPFGLQVEQVFEDYEYIGFFIISGVLASICQVGILILTSTSPVPPVVGASGAIAGVLGVLAVKNSQETVYFLFVIPMKLWMAIGLFIGGSTVAVLLWGAGAGGVGHIAHVTGAVFGVIVGLLNPESFDGHINVKPPEPK